MATPAALNISLLSASSGPLRIGKPDVSEFAGTAQSHLDRLKLSAIDIEPLRVFSDSLKNPDARPQIRENSKEAADLITKGLEQFSLTLKSLREAGLKYPEVEKSLNALISVTKEYSREYAVLTAGIDEKVAQIVRDNPELRDSRVYAEEIRQVDDKLEPVSIKFDTALDDFYKKISPVLPEIAKKIKKARE